MYQVRSPVNSRAISYLASAESNDEVSDGCVLSLTTTMRHHHTPAGRLRHLASLDRLCHRSNLIHFQQQAVARLLIDGLLYSLGIGHSQIVTALTNDTSY